MNSLDTPGLRPFPRRRQYCARKMRAEAKTAKKPTGPRTVCSASNLLQGAKSVWAEHGLKPLFLGVKMQKFFEE